MSTQPMTSAIKPASSLRNILSIARRNLQHIKANPELIVEMTVQPIMFLLLFVFVFGGAIADSWQEYLQYALPGILVQGVAFLPFATAIGLNVDFQRGVIDRFRSMPISRSAVIGGRILADSVRITWSVIMITAFGVLIGFRFGGTAPEVILGMLVVIAFGLALCSPMAYVGIMAKTTESVNTLGFLIILPLTFASSAFAPPETMPGWLQTFAEWNPVTSVIDTARGLMLDVPPELLTVSVEESLVRAIGWIVGITAIFTPLAIAKYRKRA